MERELTPAEKKELKDLEEEIQIEAARWEHRQLNITNVQLDPYHMDFKLGAILLMFKEMGFSEDRLNLHYRRAKIATLQNYRRMMEENQSDIAIPQEPKVLGPDGRPMKV